MRLILILLDLGWNQSWGGRARRSKWPIWILTIWPENPCSYSHSPSHEKCVNQQRGILICLHSTGLLSTCICYVYLLSTLSFKFLVLYLFIRQVFIKNLLCVNIPWHAGTITVSKTNLVPLFGNSQAGGRQLPSTVPERSPGDGIPNLAGEVGVGSFRMFRSLLCVQGGK